MTTDPNFNFDWRIIRDAIAILGLTYALVVLFGSCGSSKTIETVSNDSVKVTNIEKVNEWYDISKIDTFIRDRFITIVLSEKGDTIKEKELVYVREKAESKSNADVKVEKVDSVNTKSDYTSKQVVEKSFTFWQKLQLDTYLYLLLLCLLSIVFVIFKVRK